MQNRQERQPEPLKPLKWYKGLVERKGRADAGAFLVEGRRAIGQVIGTHPAEIMEILCAGGLPDPHRGYPCREVSASQLNSISSAVTPQDMIAVVRMPAGVYSDQMPENVKGRWLLLEDVQDPGNVGTLIRTAAAFDFSGVILSEKCADPYSPKCVQSSAGTLLSLCIRKTAACLALADQLKKNGFPLVAADLGGSAETSFLRGKVKLLLALGNEAAGLSTAVLKLADYRLSIPINREKAESLNVAIAGALCMYIVSRP